MQINGAQLLWESLRLEGVDTVFGYPGGAILPIYDALEASPVRHVLARHEQGAVHMADGYARASGRVGVVLATSGPGATNLVTGLATAMMDSIPLVALTGQVTSSLLGTDAFQEVDVTGITLPVTKHNHLVRRAQDIAPAVHRAFALARAGRPGPVLLDLTKDALVGMAEPPGAPPEAEALPALALAEADRKAAWALLKSSRRPLILAGHGVILGGAVEALRAFAEGAGIPVASTLLGLGAFPASHPMSLGFMGMHGAPWVNLAIQEADLLIALGMRFDDRATGNLSRFAPHARRIHVEIDPSELGKNVPVDLPILGDVKAFLEALLPDLPAADRGEWHGGLARRREAFRAPDWPPVPAGEGLHPLEALREIAVQCPRALLATDVGQNQMWAAQAWRFESPRTLLTSGGLGTMGFGLPAALGAKLACPGAEVWAVAGDGGIQMNSQELMTLAQEGVKVNVAILNNGHLGMVRQWQTLFYGDRRSEVRIPGPDFVKLAGAYGIPAFRACTQAEAREAVRRAREAPGPVLVEFQVDPEACVYPIVPPGGGLQEMIHHPGSPTPLD